MTSTRTSPEPFLCVRNVNKSYDGHTRVVQDMNLDIQKGEFVTFLGPSGSGKTTMLSMVAGFEAPTSGDIRLNGRSLLDVPVHRRNIGIVFQSYALFPHMNALENVAFPLQMRKVPAGEIDQRARRALDTVGLSQHVEKLPAQLSGGQQQRVALARALVFGPDVLLLDEPLSALDKNLRVQMQIEIKRLHQELNITTIFVTHDQSEAMTLSDRIAVFSHGCIEQFASPMEIYAKPATRFVGSFVGESNFIDVVASDGADDLYRSEHLGLLKGPSHPRPGSGAGCTMMIRPEVIRILPASVPSPVGDDEGGSAADFVIDNIISFGDSALVLGSAARLPLRVRVPQIEVSDLRIGERRTIRWDPRHAHVLPLQ